MKTRSLALLAAATVLAVVAAAIVTSSRQSDPSAVPVGQRLFPDLPTRAEAVTRIEITRGHGSIALALADGRWVAADRGNYPANTQRVRELVVDMAQLTTLEPKTSTPALYGEMEVEDPTGDEPRSGMVRLLDASGNVVAGLVVGRTRSGRSADADTVFVRRAGEAQSWLARGRMALPRDAYEWLDRFVVEVERPRVQQVTTVQPDGAGLTTVARDSQEATDFTLRDVPEGRRAKPAVDINQVGQAFDRLELEDVRPADGIAFAPDGAHAEVRTFDGLTVTAQIAEHEGQTWVRFVARGAPPPPAAPAVPAAPAPATPSEQQPAQAPADQAQTAPATPATPATPPAATPAAPAPAPTPPQRDVAQEAAEINARVGRWAYRLPAYRVEAFKRKLEDLLEARSS